MHEEAPTPLRLVRLLAAAVATLVLSSPSAAAPERPLPVASQAAQAPPASPASGSTPQAEVGFETQVRPLLSRYCFRCHGPEKKKGGLRLDVLDPDLVGGDDAEDWRTALTMLERRKMPPLDERQMTDAERGVALGWLTRSLDRAAIARRGAEPLSLRRLTRAQYTWTLQDLLGLDADFGRALPPDARSEMGFSNDGEVLQASPLHLEYYQAIARSALDRAIAVGGRPAVTRYRVRFGKGIGRGRVAGETGGYQSVPLSTDDFAVDVLDETGAPRLGADAAERAALDAVRRRISVGLRGSSHDRFRVVDEGVILYSALPHVEKAPKAWQGPSPNLKLEMQRVFPDAGDFVMRVRASRGYRPPLQQQVLVGLDAPPRAGLAPGGVVAPERALVLRARDGEERVNLRLDGEALRPVDVPSASSVALAADLPDDGVYQIDLVYPTDSADAMASVRVSVAVLGQHETPGCAVRVR